MKHLRWEQSGRTFQQTDELGQVVPNRFVYRSFAGQKNIDLGHGEYAPYTYDAVNKIYRTGDLEAHLLSDGIQFYVNGKESIKHSFHPEVEVNAAWVRKDETVSNLRIVEDKTEGATEHLHVLYDIEIEDQKATIELKFGRGNKIGFFPTISAKLDGKQRLVCEFDKIPKQISDTKYEFDDKSWWTWLVQEAEDHKVEDNKIILAEKDYTAADVVRIKPDTWGYTDAAQAADYCTEDDAWDSLSGDSQGRVGYLYAVSQLCHCSFGMRWTNVTVPNSPTVNHMYVKVFRGDDDEAPHVFKVIGVDEDNTAAYESADHHKDRDPTTAQVDWDDANGWDWGSEQISPDIAVIGTEIFSRAGWASGQAIGIYIDDDGCAQYDGSYLFDESVTNYEPELYVDYTAGAAGQTHWGFIG